MLPELVTCTPSPLTLIPLFNLPSRPEEFPPRVRRHDLARVDDIARERHQHHTAMLDRNAARIHYHVIDCVILDEEYGMSP